jgi:hypothetical protein
MTAGNVVRTMICNTFGLGEGRNENPGVLDMMMAHKSSCETTAWYNEYQYLLAAIAAKYPRTPWKDYLESSGISIFQYCTVHTVASRSETRSLYI